MAGVTLALFAGGPVIERAAADLFPTAETQAVRGLDLRPSTPFAGALFALLAGRPKGGCVGLVVPVVLAAAGDRPAGGTDALAAPPGALLPIADHVNLELRGPLTGRWPVGVPRDFPSLTDIYQPGLVRAAGGARVYSSGVVVAGVGDVRRLTAFESRAVREAGVSIVSDSLVPVTIAAAYYGLRLAACGVLQAPDRDRE